MASNVKTNRLRRGGVLAALFIVYGAAHLLAASFFWLIVFALAREGYSDGLREPKTLALFCSPLLAVVPPLLSAYSLLRGRLWAGTAVLLTCAAVLLFCLIVAAQISQPALSPTRAAFGVIYCTASVALCFYAFRFVKTKAAV